VPAVVLVLLSWRVNVLSLGEREARSLGMNVVRTRNVAMICATLATAGSICVSGTIGWVGLVIPHFARLIVGSDNTRVIPASIILGGIFLLIVDTAARMIGPLELPISILTGIIGAPFYAWLLYRQRRRLD
jgi:iron complex transport system permease protein